MKQKIKYTILYGLVLLVLAYNLYVVLELDKEMKAEASTKVRAPTSYPEAVRSFNHPTPSV